MNTETQTSPTTLIILDGFGLADFENKGNAITPETAPNIFEYYENYPSTELKAHGEAVGLFEGQAGNSEAGHFNIGAGRVVKQDLVRISERIEDGRFFKNEAFKQGLHHAQKYDQAVHIMMLLTDQDSPHARPEHLYALLDFFADNDQDNVYLHLFTDGRDSSPHSAPEFLKELNNYKSDNVKIATVMGRFYGMDRNKNWSRTEQAYNAITKGEAEYTVVSAREAIKQAYNRGETDEYISPTIIEQDRKKPLVQDNDVVYFMNARSDRARQLSKVFVQDDFLQDNPNAFERDYRPDNTRFVALTDFGPDLPGIFTAFPSPDIPNCLAKAIDDNRDQLYISETEKYAHVTFFLNGGYPKPINGEDRELIQSDDVETFAEKPEMEA
ncbi:MAG: 2,3-bisphosphoglycerate-independent phosphoglycerate mutase, partial [Candidatus Magasanikbacteria bacterium]